MCGIAGIVAPRGPTPTRDELARMCDVLVHRGPDDSGCLVDGAVGLAMRRLAIIDLAGGRQPVSNEDGTVAVVCNGEIYNYRELRRDLQARGHVFRTASDTEVLVHLWEQYGAALVDHLDGMFAFALYDRGRQRLLLARDPAGIKPLYYSDTGAAFVFGSEIKALLASGRVGRSLDVDALGQFLAWEYVPGAGTLLAQVRRLEPGCVLELATDTGVMTLGRPPPRLAALPAVPQRSAAEWEEETDAAIRRSVRRQLVSDVPLGAFLSGGVDSSLVAAAMGPAEVFSISFDDPDYDETRWARHVASHLGLRHEVELVRPQVPELFGRLMHFMDDPIGDFSIFPTFLVAQMARRQVTVALTGDGGDELFGGYETYLAEERFRTWRRLPRWLRHGLLERLALALPPRGARRGLLNKARRFAEGARLDPALGHARWRLFCTTALQAELLTPAARAVLHTPLGAHIEALQQRAASLDARNRALYVDFGSYLAENCLAKVDRMSMACSLEARVPLLGREVVELAFRIPGELKFRGTRSKILLKRVAARHLPRAAVYRPKRGFSMPIADWLRQDLRGLAEHYLDGERLRGAGLFQPETVARLWREHCDRRANHAHLLWSLLVFEQWRDRWSVTL